MAPVPPPAGKGQAQKVLDLRQVEVAAQNDTVLPTQTEGIHEFMAPDDEHFAESERKRQCASGSSGSTSRRLVPPRARCSMRRWWTRPSRPVTTGPGAAPRAQHGEEQGACQVYAQ